MSNLQHVSPAPPPQTAPSSPLYYPTPPRPSPAAGLIAGLLLTIVLLVLAVGAAFILLVSYLTGWGERTIGDAGQRAATTVHSVTDTLARAGQDTRDRFDPSHPPREGLVYDSEIEEFLKLAVGASLPGGATRALSLAAIKSREDADRPELARYAVVHSELRQPNETRLFGLTVRREAEARDDYVYQGESFRVGGQVYKVNWISPERQQMGLVQLRNPDRASSPLKFVYD